MRLTIGMAVFDDFDGVYFTVQCMREMHQELLSDCELMVVDNNPNSSQGQRVRNFIQTQVKGDFGKAAYVPFSEIIGTAAPRDEVFKRAAGEYVLCVDSHVILQRGALESLLKYYDEHWDTRDLICGPIIYDDRRNILGTHFDDVWRHGMWGIWAMDHRGDINDQRCSGEPFEIPAQGLGLFSCRKDAWLGFNRAMDGFGGEEWYIHTKYRQAGHRVICIPQLRWLHRFRGEATPYPSNTLQKARNYVIGHRELGLPLDRAYKHFVKGINEDGSSWTHAGDHEYLKPGVDLRKLTSITEHIWSLLTKEPTPTTKQLLEHQNIPVSACPSCGAQEAQTLEELYDHVSRTPHDINEHCWLLRELSSQCEHVTEWGKRHNVSTTALLAGQPKILVSYAEERYREADGFE